MIAEVEQRTPDLPIRIIAGNRHQAEGWARREELKPKDWRYVSGPQSLLGVKNVRIVWIGTFWDRRDFAELCNMVDPLVTVGHVVVDRNEVTNKGRKTRPKTKPETGTTPGLEA